jgi:hypothetical protein
VLWVGRTGMEQLVVKEGDEVWNKLLRDLYDRVSSRAIIEDILSIENWWGLIEMKMVWWMKWQWWLYVRGRHLNHRGLVKWWGYQRNKRCFRAR